MWRQLDQFSLPILLHYNSPRATLMLTVPLGTVSMRVTLGLSNKLRFSPCLGDLCRDNLISFLYQFSPPSPNTHNFTKRNIKERGTVSMRVACLLRSAEVQPLFWRFVWRQLDQFLYQFTTTPITL